GNAEIADNRIAVNGLRIVAGSSSIEASGTLKDPQGNGSLQFKTTLSLDELGRMAKLDAHPGGVVVANGTAKLDSANNYQVRGDIGGRNLSFQQGVRRIQNVNIHSALELDPKKLELRNINVAALGGEFDGDASLEEFARYSVSGTLRHFG